MGVRIAEQKASLEEEHAGDPDRGGTAKPGQNQLGDKRLNQEQQTGADKDSDSEQES
jgi:hypothetical protein